MSRRPHGLLPLAGWALLGVLLGGSAGCAGLKDLVPHGPVLSAADRADLLRAAPPSVDLPHDAVRACPDLPLIPLQIFGVDYGLDLVLRPRDPAWDMLELARVDTPEGPLWLAKAAPAPSKSQVLVTDAPATAWPEVPLTRHPAPVRVIDTSTPRRVKLQLAWEQPDGATATLDWRSPWPAGPRPKRNTSTMGHSADTVLAVLDLSRLSLAGRARLRFDGERVRLRHLLGIVPFRVALGQTQAGLAVGDWTVEAGADGPELTRAARPGRAAVTARLHREEGPPIWVETDALRTVRATYGSTRPGVEQLAQLQITGTGTAPWTGRVVFSPPLPDLRWAHASESEHDVIFDVAGQEGHALARATVRRSADGGGTIDLQPLAPEWTLDRPLRSTIVCTKEQIRVASERVPVPPPLPTKR